VKGVDWLSRLIFDEDDNDFLVVGFHAVCPSLSHSLKLLVIFICCCLCCHVHDVAKNTSLTVRNMQISYDIVQCSNRFKV